MTTEKLFAMEVSVVIPCLNEAATVAAVVRRAQRALDEHGVHGEVVVADNGSTDGSQARAAEAGARVVPVADRGYGAALRGGIAAAHGRYAIMGDADGSYDFGHLPRFLAPLRAGHDLVVGNRFRGGIEPGAMPFLHRRLGNPVLTFIGRRLFGTPCGDIYCGLRAFDRAKIVGLDLRSSGMEYAIEMVVKSTLTGLRVTEVPTVLSPDERDHAPHLRTWRDGWRSLRFLLLYSPAWLFLYPGIALIVLGLAGMALLIPGSRSVGSVTFDAHTLFYAAIAIVIGFQSVIFFVSARLFAVTEGLLPEDPRLTRVTARVTLERGLAAGALLTAAGLAVSLYAVLTWNAKSFGRLDFAHTLRIVIPGGTLLSLGVQVILASLFVGILRLARR